ncbi:hypothetical protein C2S51_026516 [Perilla frutescens var. frutescens]|nr:hypothetical protein C2S51_026516 [Perilla frutescens var. frutescens]
MKDVVKTAVLSNRWRNLWTTSPYLNFDCHELDDDGEHTIRTFVNRALLSWRGIKLQKFKIDIHCRPQKSLSSDFDLWVRLAVDKNVEELYVHRSKVKSEAYLVPQYLFSCSSLKVLSLEGCDLKSSGNVQWNHLKSLKVEGVRLRDCEHVFNQVLCGSPQLEVLILVLCDNEENLNIRSRSLKKLLIDNYLDKYLVFGGPYQDTFHTELKIWTPNLESLEISGVPYSKCLLMDISSLTDATLGFYGLEIYDSELFYGEDILYQTLRDILRAIEHVERVALSDWCIKLLGDRENRDVFSQPFSNIKFLKLNASRVDYEVLVGGLVMFPELKMLVLQDEMVVHHLNYLESVKFDAYSSLKFEEYLPTSFLRQLRTVEITWDKDDDSIFPFLEIVLKYARKLEKMVIRVIREEGMMPPSDSLFMASQKLLGMPRSSPNCRVSVL